jgi:cyclophilin family peptidyl-prolyl cis-trans isomerase
MLGSLYNSSEKARKGRPYSLNSNQGRFGLVGMVLVAAFTIAGVAYGGYCYFIQYETKHEMKIREEIVQNELEPITEELHQRLKTIQNERKTLQIKLEDDEKEIQLLRKRTTEDLPTLQKQVDSLLSARKKLQYYLQRMSYADLVEKYDATYGPIFRVHVQLSFDPLANTPGTATEMVFELYPIEKMPHSVYFFVSQVHNGFFDGTSFHRNANHVVQAGPAPNYLSPPGTTSQTLRKRFADSNYDSLYFQEYSPEYPHVKYTLGYAGRPGGPDFFINLKDNTKIHGPSGQIKQYDGVLDYYLAQDADPCFGRVVYGFDTVNRLHQSSILQDQLKHMEHNVAIVKMRLITEKEYKQNYTQAPL